MAHLAVLGATGGTGQELVRRALGAGHSVTALARRPEALPVSSPHLSVLVGDAREATTIHEVVVGADAVIVSLGRPESGLTKEDIDDSVPVDVCTVATRHLLEVGPRVGLTRIVLMSTHGAGSSNDGSPYTQKLRDMVGNRVRDKDDMEALLASATTDITWTVIRNPRIYAGKPGQPYGVHRRIELDWSSCITYGDLAAFAIDEALHPKYAGEFVTITEPLTGDPA